MQKNKKKLILVICLIALILISATLIYGFVSKSGKSDDKTNNLAQNSLVTAGQEFVLEGYPIDDVPLYSEDLFISSMKYIVNENPINAYDKFFGAKRNYFNVVFETDATQAEVFDFYKSKMSQINQENTLDTTVEGVIKKYRVSISNYGYKDFYLQVHLPVDEYSKTNRYYQDYPELVEIAGDWVEYENSYGMLNQNDGEIEYTQWFDVATPEEFDANGVKIDPVNRYYEIYKEKYVAKTNLTADDADRVLEWTEDGYSVTATFSVDHGRVYLMFRKPMK